MMLTAMQWLIAAAVPASLLAVIAILGPQRYGVKVIALFSTALFLPLAYTATNDFLGRPKPIHLENTQRYKENVSVLAFTVEEGESIYVWLKLTDMVAPRAYRLPWSQDVARQLHDARREADAKGTEVQMRNPFERDDQVSEPQFHAKPPESLPPKSADVA